MAVTPSPGQNLIVLSGGSPTIVFGPNINGGIVVNPLLASDQALATSEVLYIDPTGNAPTLSANNTTFALQPGQSWIAIPGQTSNTTVTSVTTGHRFSAVWW